MRVHIEMELLSIVNQKRQYCGQCSAFLVRGCRSGHLGPHVDPKKGVITRGFRVRYIDMAAAGV
jgi:hypothetical protein